VIVRLLSEVFRLQHLHGEAFVIGQVTPYVAGALFAAVAFALTVICYFASLFRIFMLNPQTLSNIDVKADLLESDKAPADPLSAAVRSIQKATGLDEGAAKALLDQAKVKANAAKPQQVKAKAVA
jgi:hypothetical protein